MGLAMSISGCGKSGARSARLAFSTDFESGAAQNLHVRPDGSIAFSITPDPGGPEYLWFYFRVSGATEKPPEFVIENAAKAHQSGERWNITRPVFSADGITWLRAEKASYIREFSLSQPLGKPVFRFTSPIAAETLQVAYCYPYTRTTLDAFLGTIGPRIAGISSIGKSEEQREIPCFRIGAEAPEKARIWVICREHPGETPASFVLEGMAQALLDHPAGWRLMDHFSFTFVPMLNVDGVTRGYYYHNAKGVNLARDWVAFSSAEVRALKDALEPVARKGALQLVINLHSSNDPGKGHFFLEMPSSKLKKEDAERQRSLFDAADGNHPQLNGKSRVNLLDLPGITGNALYRDYGVYCLYLETNYSRGADGSIVTPRSLREVGLALTQALAEVFVPE